jgi:hypothetical protein
MGKINPSELELITENHPIARAILSPSPGGFALSISSFDLIFEAENDVAEFGEFQKFVVYLKKLVAENSDIYFISNYDFPAAEKPLNSEELKEDEFPALMYGGLLLELLYKQSEIL